MRIADETVEQVRAATDIVSLVGEAVSLRRSGRNHMGLCPFHQERTPSFSVNPERGIFHCFGCGKGGDVFSFVMETQGVGFLDAVRILAERSGIEIERSEGQSHAEALYRMNAFAARFYQEVLMQRSEGAVARRYAQARGISPDQAKHFGLGFAPDAWDALGRRAASDGFSQDLLKTGGLSLDNRNRPGQHDRFRNRLIFPIRAATGRVVAFGGRSLGDDEGPKYINSPETPVYRKGDHLFGLSEAREEIRRARSVVVVEGYTDCLAMHRAGAANTVAALGTAFTPRQAELLRRYADDVILVFDADAAGQAAALRGMGILLAQGLQVKTAVLPAGNDPDSLLAEGGAGAITEAISRPVDAVEHHLEELVGRARDAGPAARVKSVAPLIEALQPIADSALRDAYLAEIANRIRIDPGALHRKAPRRTMREEQEHRGQGEEPPRLDACSRELLRLALSDLAGKTFARIDAARIADGDVREIYTILAKEYEESGEVRLGRVLDQIPSEPLRTVLTGIATSAETEATDLDTLLEDVVQEIEETVGAQRRWELNRRLDQEDDPDRRKEIVLELTKLLRKKQRRI